MPIRNTEAHALKSAARTRATRIIAAIVCDLDDRRGIKSEYRAIDEETRAEMIGVWEDIVRRELAEPRPPPVSVDAIRAQGWSVAVHNDYRQDGEPHTFWLFTKGWLAVKGEGKTDEEALEAVLREIAGLAEAVRR